MKHILALDTGGTKCEAILFAEDGVIVGDGLCYGKSIEGAKSNGGPGRSKECIGAAASQALAGVDCRELLVANTKRTTLELVDLTGIETEYMYFPEGESALALVGEKNGVAVLAGTGAIVTGITKDGHALALDGLGPLLGDYGSASHIGHMAIRAACRSQWHPRHNTVLGKAVRLALGGREDDPWGGSLIAFSFSPYDRADIAGLSKIVNEAAADGDAIAVQILHDAAAALAGTVFDVVDRLGMAGDNYPMVGTGGMLSHSPMYWQLLCENVHKFAPKLRPIISDLRPVVGIATRALQTKYPDDWQPRAETLRQSARARFAAQPSATTVKLPRRHVKPA